VEDFEDEKPARGPFAKDFATAALLAQPFLAWTIAMRLRYPPGPAQWGHADPILGVLPAESMQWLVPLCGAGLGIAWLVLAWPTGKLFLKGLAAGVVGALLVAGGLVLLARLRGPHLPPLLALEETPAPGPALSVMAAYLEETLCRLVVLPAVYFFMTERSSKLVSVIVASLVTGLVFAVAHESGEQAVNRVAFAVRALVPGVALSVFALVTKPSLAVVGHCAAHVAIPMCYI
jgi:hypothetical protein